MNILRERYQFHHRQQQLNETIEEYAAQLQRMASSCQFNGDKESFIRDHVLFGLSNQNITLQVIELGGNPSLIEIVEICVRLNDTEPATGNDYYMRGESNVKPEPFENEFPYDEVDPTDLYTESELKEEYDSKHTEPTLLVEIQVPVTTHDEEALPKNQAHTRSAAHSTIKTVRTIRSESSHRTRSTSNRIHSEKRARQHRYVNSKPLMCPQCPRIFKDEAFYREHINNKHNEASCRFCRKVFKGQATLDYHRKAQHPETIRSIEMRQYECFICHKQYKSLQLLRSHIYSHMRSRTYLCPQCGYFAQSPNGLEKHMMRNDHNLTGEVIKPHRCETCGQAFATRHTLVIHMTSHSDVRNVPCTICGKAFKNTKNLGQHMLTHGERKHKCHMCPYRCYSPGNLKVHMKVHTGRGER